MSSTDVARFDIDPSELKLPHFSPVSRFSPDELVGKVFVRNLENGQNYHAKMVRKIQDHDADCHKKTNFLVEIGDGQYDEIIAYHQLCHYIETQEDQEINPEEPRWTFLSIEGPVGPIKRVIMTIRVAVIMSLSNGKMGHKPMMP
jgi:hypothetical protein